MLLAGELIPQERGNRMFDHITESIKEHERGREFRDYVLSAGGLEMSDQGTMIVPTNGHFSEFQISELPLRQMCQKIGFPLSYGRKIPAHLLAKNVNYWLKHPDVRSKGVMVRTESSLESMDSPEPPKIRAVMSDQYIPVSNSQFIDQMKNAIDVWSVSAHNGVFREMEMSRFDYDGDSMYAVISVPSVENEVVDGDEIQGGIYFCNSEVGLRAMRVSTMLIRMICTNGLISFTGKEDGFYQRHVHYSPHDLFPDLVAGLGQAVDRFGDGMDTLRKARDMRVADPVKVMEDIVEKASLPAPKKLVEHAREIYNNDPYSRDDMYSVVNSLTWAAQRFKGVERTSIEEVAGKLLRRVA